MFLEEKQKPVKRIVKLFPRLVTARSATVRARMDRPLARGRKLVTSAMSDRELESARVRARLLKMILDNEGLRHNERGRA
jgi:hypothetical protein